MWFSVSMTDRPPRPGEEHGRDYFFVTREEFERLRDDDGLLEWFEVYGDLKGTPRAPVERHLVAGEDVVLEVDVQGALAVKATFPDAHMVFIRPPSRDVQRRRLLDRDPGADPAALEERLRQADAEESRIGEFERGGRQRRRRPGRRGDPRAARRMESAPRIGVTPRSYGVVMAVIEHTFVDEGLRRVRPTSTSGSAATSSAVVRRVGWRRAVTS
jgi:guanylate kinase